MEDNYHFPHQCDSHLFGSLLMDSPHLVGILRIPNSEKYRENLKLPHPSCSCKPGFEKNLFELSRGEESALLLLPRSGCEGSKFLQGLKLSPAVKILKGRPAAVKKAGVSTAGRAIADSSSDYLRVSVSQICLSFGSGSKRFEIRRQICSLSGVADNPSDQQFKSEAKSFKSGPVNKGGLAGTKVANTKHSSEEKAAASKTDDYWKSTGT
ncbi:OLC1v1024101C1 [Oldenlandia corymbosa var. corymbosa]|uniref:OLC1v1024101C1 n=1 Tax=Oldenlandia corymbosa var. corymbosa TaxID=529605 RepID=A0AAV1C4C0_OLDCO|nr:OLC1v1024101C1 [Oldenlandia corymbosa var. corymbosa]